MFIRCIQRLALIVILCQSTQAIILTEGGTVHSSVINIFRFMQTLFLEDKLITEDDFHKTFSNIKKNVCLEDLNTLAQKSFLRPPNKERYELEEFNERFTPYELPALYNLFRSIGDINEVSSVNQPVDYILLNGSLVDIMERCMMFLKKCLQQGSITCSNNTSIVVLTGERLLTENEKKMLASNTSPTMEHEAAALLINKLIKNDPLFGDYRVEIIKATDKEIIDSITGVTKKVRPTTADTIKAWLATQPTPGNCVSVSRQPFVYYQQATIKGFLDCAGWTAQGYWVQGIGQGITDEELNNYPAAALPLDNLARTIYTEITNRNQMATT